jgi:hypothetical protein
MEKEIKVILLIGIIAVLGFILIFYKDDIKNDTEFRGTHNERYELTNQINSSNTNNQPQKIGTVTVKPGETNRIDIKGV